MTVTHVCGGSEGCMCMYDPKLNPNLGGCKDLRGQPVRQVHRDDSVIITGAEYIRKSHATDQLEIALRWLSEGLEDDCPACGSHGWHPDDCPLVVLWRAHEVEGWDR